MTPEEILKRIQAVAEAEDDDFEHLVTLSGLNPKTDFVNADLSGIDLRWIDAGKYNFDGCQVSRGAVSKSDAVGRAVVVDVPFRKRRRPKRDQRKALHMTLAAHSAVKSGRLDEAERLFREAEAADPQNADCLGDFARFMHIVRQDMAEAERLYLAAETVDPKHGNNLGNFAVFMNNVRQDMDGAERLYRAAIAADPKHARNLGNFAWFLQSVRQDMDEAERMYRAAEMVDPKYAHNLASFAVFMKNVRQDMDEAERLYRAAEVSDPKDARILGGFAWFMRHVRQDMDEAERLYRAAEAADPKGADNLVNFAVFMRNVRQDMAEAERLCRAAVAAAPEHANSLGNLAWILIADGREGEAVELVGRALEAAEPDVDGPVILECWFYRYAVYPEWREQALAEVAGLIGDGVRSPGWDLRGVVARGEALGHPRPDLLRAVAAVIAEEAGADTLAAFGDWPKAA